MKNVLTIAGSDSGGGAGIQADLKTFAALRTYGMSVITAVTAQNTTGVSSIENLSPQIITAQIDAVFSDIRVDAVKIGMVSGSEIINEISKGLKKWQAEKIVLDPVMVSTAGNQLLQEEARENLIKKLFPLAELITPNIPEAETILARKIESVASMKKAAEDLAKLGASNVLLKGGHRQGAAVDILFAGSSIVELKAARIKTDNTHGSGCTYSSAIAAHLAQGFKLQQAVKLAKKYITGAIEKSFSPGRGAGPVHHFHQYY